jgi:hypothetical protein
MAKEEAINTRTKFDSFKTNTSLMLRLCGIRVMMDPKSRNYLLAKNILKNSIQAGDKVSSFY